jgi:RHS repeat-associated protein
MNYDAFVPHLVQVEYSALTPRKRGGTVRFFAIDSNQAKWVHLVSTPPAQPEPMQYVGQYGYYTDATGFVYVRNRYYDPVNGTWISRDPIGFGHATWNQREYVNNSPISSIDPSGYDKDVVPPLIGRSLTDHLFCRLLGIHCDPISKLQNRWIRALLKNLAPISEQCGGIDSAIGKLHDLGKVLNCPTGVDEVIDKTRQFYVHREQPGMCQEWCWATVKWITSCMIIRKYGDLVTLLLEYSCPNWCSNRGFE